MFLFLLELICVLSDSSRSCTVFVFCAIAASNTNSGGHTCDVTLQNELTSMTEEVTESVTVSSKLLEIVIIDNFLEGVVPKPVRLCCTSNPVVLSDSTRDA